MNKQAEKAVQNHREGCNCSQAVACAFCDRVGLDRELAFEIMEGFGLGMGCMEGTCGALSGAAAIASLYMTQNLPAGPGRKGKTYAAVRQIMERFQAQNGSVLCRELKGRDTGVVLRGCDGCIADAAELLDEIIFAAPSGGEG